MSENAVSLKLRSSLSMLSLSLVASNGCPPSLTLYQEKGSPRTIKDLQPVLSTTRSRPEIIRSPILSLPSYECDDLFKSTTYFYEYGKFFKSASIRTVPLFVNVQEFFPSILLSSSIDEWWTKYQQIMQAVSSRVNGLKEDSLDHCLLLDLIGLQAKPIDLHLQHVASSNFEVNGVFVEKASLSQGADRDLFHDLPLTISVHPDGQLLFVTDMADMIDQASGFTEFGLTKDTNLWRQQKMLVPRFGWNDTVELQDDICPSSLKLEAAIAAPFKSPDKAKPKTSPNRKNKKAARERNLYRNNSLHACESLLSVMLDKKRNWKSVLGSLKKSGPELPQLLTQFSASITGVGLAVIFSVLYKVASGSALLCTSNVLTSGFGVALFWLSWAVNKLRSTVIYISKTSAKLGFEEEEMMRRVDESVKEIFFHAAASIAILMLRFA